MKTHATPISSDQRDAFYLAAIAGLRALDARNPQRFGPAADARWRAFGGALTEADRVELLLRDAAASWGAAFSPAEAFDLFGLAPDEAFGPDWPPAGDAVVRRANAGDVLSDPDAYVRLLGLSARRVAVPSIGAATRVAVAGVSAIVAVAQAFRAQPDARWSDQVLVVASSPAERQLAGLAAILVASPARTRLVRPEDDLRAALKAMGTAQVDHAVASDDAEGACAAFARRAAGQA